VPAWEHVFGSIQFDVQGFMGRVRAVENIFEVPGLTIRAMTEFAAKDTEGSMRVSEALCHLIRRQSVNEICTQSLVLAMQRLFWFYEELLFWH